MTIGNLELAFTRSTTGPGWFYLIWNGGSLFRRETVDVGLYVLSHYIGVTWFRRPGTMA